MNKVLKKNIDRPYSILILRTFFFSLLLLPASRLSGENNRQDVKFLFQKISIDEGLSQDSVKAIIQDRSGYIWIATTDGLNRYDGNSFKVYKHHLQNPNSISDNWIRTVFEDREGYIWIGTNHGLSRLDPLKNEIAVYWHESQNSFSLSSDNIQSIFQDHWGDLWIGTEKGLNRFDRRKNRFTRYRSGEEVDVICEDRSGQLWMAINQRLYCFDREKEVFVAFHEKYRMPGSITAQFSYPFSWDRSGFLSIKAKTSGLFRINPQNGKIIRFHLPRSDPSTLSDNHVKVIYETRSGELWIGTENDGLFLFDPKTEKFIHFTHEPGNLQSLSNKSVSAIFEDDTGILWVGTYGGGITKMVRKKEMFQTLTYDPNDPGSISDKSVHALFVDSLGTLWVGTADGLNRLDPGKSRFIRYFPDAKNPDSLSHQAIKSINEDKHGTLWIGTSFGLSLFDRRTGKFRRLLNDPQDENSLSNNYIRAICKDRSGIMWVGTQKGLNRYDKNGVFTRFLHQPDDPSSLSHDYVYALLEDRRGYLWVATLGGGVNRFDRQQKKFTHFVSDPAVSNSLSNPDVLSLCEDNNGVIWAGTKDGLNRFDEEMRGFKKYFEENGLPNNCIYSILCDGAGNLWVSTNKGIGRFNPRHETCRNFFRTDGLQNNEFNGNAGFKSKSGMMYFGGIDGLNSFLPEGIRDNPHIPLIVITDFKIFNKSVASGGQLRLQDGKTAVPEIQLSHRDQVISFEFAILDYTSPDKNQYAYKMEGFDSDWVYIGNKHDVTYTNLNPGEYRFRVKGSNNDGIWNEQGVSLKIKIVPPFWKTWWFYLLCGVFIGVTVLSFYKYRINQLKKMGRQLSILVKKRTSELHQALEQVEYANQELEKANVELERLSLTDSLTNLPNRRNFEIIFAQEWKRSTRESQPLSILMIDIDFFKLYNDTYGHPSGDLCLKQVAVSIHRCASRAGDFVARVGGEEFVAVLPNTHTQGANLLAEKMRAGVEELQILHKSSIVSAHVTVSIGVATITPAQNDKSDTLVVTADQALYQAKKEGRNRICSMAIGAKKNEK